MPVTVPTQLPKKTGKLPAKEPSLHEISDEAVGKQDKNRGKKGKTVRRSHYDDETDDLSG